MSRKEATEEYAKALKEGQKEYKECIQKAVDPNPAVLDELLPADVADNCVKIGLVNIPVKRIVGTKSAGRVSAFTPTFRPLLEADTEFATKWISLCADHLGDVGIQQPVECYEYLGNFYIQEGNKRVSVLRHFGAPRIAANVKRVQPVMDDSPRMKAYGEFLEFYKLTGLYDVQYTTPGSYASSLRPSAAARKRCGQRKTAAISGHRFITLRKQWRRWAPVRSCPSRRTRCFCGCRCIPSLT